MGGFHPQAFTNSPRLFPVGCKGAHNLEVFCAIKSTVSPYKWCIYQVGQKGDRNTYSYSLLLPNTNCLAPKSIHQSAILSYLLAPSFVHQHLLWWHPWRLIAQTGWRRICKFAGQRFYVWPWPRSPGQKRMPSYDWKLRRFADICTNHQI